MTVLSWNSMSEHTRRRLAPLGTRSITHGERVKRPALEALTGLRFVAAIWVVLYHGAPKFFSDPTNVAVRFASYGYIGVSLFFVLSGFILAYTYLDPATGRLRGTPKAFWWARVARVYPVYLFALALGLPLFVKGILLVSEERGRALASMILTPLLLQGWWPSAACQWNCPAWSLSVEALFYVLFPFIGVWLLRSRRSALPIALTTWAVGLMLPLLYTSLQPDGLLEVTGGSHGAWLDALKYNPIPHLPEFLIGVATGITFLNRDVSRSSRTLRRITLALILIVAIALSVGVEVPYPLLHTGVLAPLWSMLIYCLAIGRGNTATVLRQRPMVRLGEASYSLYLIHLQLLYIAMKLRDVAGASSSVPAILQLLVYAALSVAASVLIFQRIEEPARRAIRARVSASRGADRAHRPERVPAV
jgi:peptidoglycan/LPS O-acetylase OafA/YrhL